MAKGVSENNPQRENIDSSGAHTSKGKKNGAGKAVDEMPVSGNAPLKKDTVKKKKAPAKKEVVNIDGDKGTRDVNPDKEGSYTGKVSEGKSESKKTAAKNAPLGKPAPKTAPAKKTSEKKSPAKKVAAKKVTAKKAAAKKEAPAKKSNKEKSTNAVVAGKPVDGALSVAYNGASGLPYEEHNFIDCSKSVWNYSIFSMDDIANYQAGTHYSLYDRMGSRELEVLGKKGMYFAVWAPNATYVSVKGNFNEWNKTAHPLTPRWDHSGIWEGFIPELGLGELYKYYIIGHEGIELDKGDPYAWYWEKRPSTASITWNLDYTWSDQSWMQERKKSNSLDAPWSIYEMHLASWMRPIPGDEDSYNTYQQIAERLVPYLEEMGFTHVEFMPVMEHPYDGSWGYQGVGYFAPTSRFGSPQDFMMLVDKLHQAGIGVIVDWVPSHFPYDAHGLFKFDGDHTYEYADMRKGFHPDWNSYIFNYKRGEVKSFLISSARFWMDKFHIDGIRVDAVSSMLKLNYSRTEGQWEPNEHGGDGNLEAIAFIKDLNETLYRDFPDIQTMAEEATDWPGISKPTSEGGLGFGMKWMMGWMHDTLDYFKIHPYHREHHQNRFSFSMMYFYDENFLLPLSHDEVVHGKSPMLFKMPGDDWQKCANLRLLYTYMFTHPGAKLLFMGNEFGQTSEWNHKTELDWYLLQFVSHTGIKDCVKDLNGLYRNSPALYEKQFEPGGFEWVDLNHRKECVIAFKRKGKNPNDDTLVILNMLPEARFDWEIFVQGKDEWKELFNSNDPRYWGTGDVFNPEIRIETVDIKENWHKITLNLPPLAGIVLQ